MKVHWYASMLQVKECVRTGSKSEEFIIDSKILLLFNEQREKWKMLKIEW